jgi:hypothetical protein
MQRRSGPELRIEVPGGRAELALVVDADHGAAGRSRALASTITLNSISWLRYWEESFIGAQIVY